MCTKMRGKNCANCVLTKIPGLAYVLGRPIIPHFWKLVNRQNEQNFNFVKMYKKNVPHRGTPPLSTGAGQNDFVLSPFKVENRFPFGVGGFEAVAIGIVFDCGFNYFH